jgi:hypothetical protein
MNHTLDFRATIMLSASTAVGHTAEAQRHAQTQPGYGYMQAQVGHRQPTRNDVEIESANEQLDLPASQDSITGADQVQSEEDAFAKMIEEENGRLDRELRGICRGC